MRTLIAGEGLTELGDFVRTPSYRSNPVVPGVLQALMELAAPGRFQIVDGVVWKSIRKFKAGEHRAPETRNVMGLALEAKERNCVAVVFARDRDRDRPREADVERGIQRAVEVFGVAVGGAVAVEALEAWLLALEGDSSAETYADPKAQLESAGAGSLDEKVDVVRSEGSRLREAGALSPSLATWTSRIQKIAGLAE
jgi:hypothetical protein